MAANILLDIAANILLSLGSYASQEIGLALGVKEELRKMENNVSTIKNILLDAQERQMSNLAVKEWLQRLKLILYDDDDLLDEVATETKIRQGESLVKKVRYFFTSSNPLVFSYVVGCKFKDVGKRLDEIVSQMHDFQFVVKLVERPIETIRREETSSIMNTPTMIVGREDDKNNLVSLLLSSHYEENVPIIPIVGMGGLGQKELYKMHDLVHDLAQYVAGNECLSIRGAITQTIPDTVRHVSFYRDGKRIVHIYFNEGWFAPVFDWDIPWKFPRSLTRAKKLRTMLCSTKRGPTFESSEPEIGSSRCLRLLEGCHLASKLYVPEKIGKLKLLRYLSIGGVKKLPKSFCNLINLQYLDLPQSNMVKLPKDFGKLVNLRFLSFSTELTCLPKEEIGGLTSLRMLIISRSSNLRSLGEGLEHLSCLRELVLDRCSALVSLPAGFRHLTSLERLEMSSCHCFDFSNDDLKGLRSLKKLKVYNLPRLVNLPNGIQDAAASLTHLEISGCTNFTSPSEFIVPYLLSLQSLRISYCPEVRSLPEGMQRLTNLQFLSIVKCNLLTSSYKEGGEDWPKVAHIPSIELFERFKGLSTLDLLGEF
ncbi:hypothetical protein Vadar_000655 [Vaccinium darrowii]|uniref:Uncharacterized protein n=1 Tax=Vaccinium darrowii TaxID=229202 RepID=A0ACB7XMK0_9ERIC|nr:hypothetical protein Vadar_000655 [Vaccinium darrowii]